MAATLILLLIAAPICDMRKGQASRLENHETRPGAAFPCDATTVDADCGSTMDSTKLREVTSCGAWTGPATVRHGEAEHPGPGDGKGHGGVDAAHTRSYNMLKGKSENTQGGDGVSEVIIISANVASLRNKAETIASWEADVTLLQETKLTTTALGEVRPAFSEQRKKLIHGRPCRTIKREAKVVASAARESARGGVAAAVREPRDTIKVDQTDITKQLRATGRWEEVVLPARADTSHFGASVLYGVSGASQNPREHRQHEALIAKAIMRLIEFGDAPYLITGDFNIEVADSEALTSALEAGIIVDVRAAAREGEELELIYRSKGPFCGLTKEVGTASRIDFIFANPTAAAAVTSYPR